MSSGDMIADDDTLDVENTSSSYLNTCTPCWKFNNDAPPSSLQVEVEVEVPYFKLGMGK